MSSGTRDDADQVPTGSQEPSREEVEGGVDLTLIDETLAMSVQDRLRQNDRMLAMVSQLRQAVSRARG